MRRARVIIAVLALAGALAGAAVPVASAQSRGGLDAACRRLGRPWKVGVTAATQDRCVRLNQIQALGTHNSYHVLPQAALLGALRAFDASLADSLEYEHAPLADQFGEQGIRQIELDVFADPAGGIYANRAGLKAVGQDPASGLAELDQPGFKVLHVQDIDFETRCLTFVACLRQVEAWSDANPRHLPIMILVELKDDPIPDPGLGFAVPVHIGPAELDALEAEIRSVFELRDLITPDGVRGRHDTLDEAVRAGGWPTLAESRGRVMFALDNEDGHRTDYLAGHPSLRGRLLFTSSPPGRPESAFVKLNDPRRDADRIRAAVEQGYVVRTRADADTVQGRTGDVTMREAALSSGAQWVSTDYPVPSTLPGGRGYLVAIPGGSPARCNPVSAPAVCRTALLGP